MILRRAIAACFVAVLMGAAAVAQPVLQHDPGRRGQACRLPAMREATGVCYNRDCTICRNPRTHVCYSRNVPVRCPRILTEVAPSSDADGSEKP